VLARLASRALPIVLALVASSPVRAWACGASAGGVAGLSGCSLEEHNEAVRKKWHVGASTSFTSTSIRFTPSLRLDQLRSTLVAAIGYSTRRELTFEFGAGALLDGTFERAGVEYDFAPGFLLLTGASHRVVTNDGPRPFVLLGGQLAYVTAHTKQQGASGAGSVGYNAFDLRLGPVVGWTFWRTVSPYVFGRVFGGPVFWRYRGRAEVGGDTNHYQLGAGISLVIAGRFDAFVEAVPLGEQSVAGGLGLLL
jgi:hypothetical protein